jgi:ketosteroid isomerase-like protein
MKYEVITGREAVAGEVSTPTDALIEFYRAFNSGDLALMAENWRQSEEVSMSNPLGGIKRGWQEISGVYDKIFNGTAKVYVEFYDYSIHSSGEMFVAVGRERGHFRQGSDLMELAIRTSRVYRKNNGRWQQLHHHGSIESPELLAHYQSVVMAGLTIKHDHQ